MNTKLIVVLGVVCASSVFAQGAAGVSDERVVLPSAPGSIDGVGENASVSGNQGAMTYSVKIDVPAGFPDLTPNMSLSYSSSGGASLVGIGWSLPSFSIQRMTSKGLQKYELGDRFAVDGSDELVKITTSGTDTVYRARFENGFVRWTWKNQGTGEGGYWKAEYPDGLVGYFGADTRGADVPTAQVKVPTTNKVWKWHLTEMVDQFGHSMKYRWTKDSSGYPLLDRVEYLFEGSTPRHSVAFTYEGRNDTISDATPGFELKLTKRLKDIKIFGGAEVIRSYVLEYEAESVSAGATRLKTVTRFGRGNLMYPVKFSFGYSKTLGGACDLSCEKPFVRDMGTLTGVDFSQGKATLIDMNGDALPDVVYSPSSGNHQIFTSKLDTEGRSSFNATPTTSATQTTSYVLGEPRTQVIDVNGDGFTDISRAGLGILCNNGSGDWVASSFCAMGISNTDPGASFTTDDSDAAQADPKYVRFFDYDNDRRIDYLRTVSGGTTTEVLANTTSGFVPAPNIQNIGIGVFDDSPLQLADMNGDGLQDPVNLIASGAALQINYKLNLGYGQWGSSTTITLSGLDPSQVSVAELQDINGDGLADVVAVSGNEVRYALNRNGDRFDAVQVLANTALGSGMIPTKATGTVVVYADMNGNGSDDIVWIQPSGLVQYLELFPVRPNLISRIENAIGAVQLFSYGTSLREQVRDTAANKPWANRVPNAYTLVTQIQTFVTLTGSDTGGLKEIENFSYHSGFYDGVEKQFRGYEGVERELVSDMSRDSQQPGRFVETYDVGKTDPLLAGVQTRSQAWALMGTTMEPLHDQKTEYQSCAVAETTGGVPAPKFACLRAQTTTFIERNMANAGTTRSEYDYDGYGNVTVSRELGVSNMGPTDAPTACEACVTSGEFGKPCGAMCLGDEQFVETTYIVPGTATGNAWFTKRRASERRGSVAGMYNQEEQFFYDGPEFEGLPLGQLTKGAQNRTARRTGSGANDFLTMLRIKRDMHGNVVEEIGANGTIADVTTARRVYTYEPAGLNLASTEVKVGGGISLKRDYLFDTSWEKVQQASNWVTFNNGAAVSSAQYSKFRYDDHGRVSKFIDPGDAEGTPSAEFSYELAAPASRILSQQRSTAGGTPDVITAKCFDGRGREYQSREKLSDTKWQVSGFTEFDARGAPARRFNPYVGATGACDMAPPTNVPFTKYTYDALGREISVLWPGGALARSGIIPFGVRQYDAEDTEPTSPAFNTPTTRRFDGLGRLVAIERPLAASGGTVPTLRIGYDAMTHLSTIRDAAAHLRTQTYSMTDRLMSVTDTNSGTWSFEYDNQGNRTKVTDARGKVTRASYDGANRVTGEWDDADKPGTLVARTYDRLAGCTECTNLGGLLAEAAWPAGRERFGYDTKAKPIFQESTIDGHVYTTRQTYDNADRNRGTTYPGGISVTRKFDGASRLTSIDNFVNSIEYDDTGSVKSVTYGNNAKTEYTYNDRLELMSLKSSSGDVKVLDLTYTRNKLGDLTMVADGDPSGDRPRHASTNTYDAWNRVKSMSLKRTGAEAEVLSFELDQIDNITSITSSLGESSRAHIGALTYDTMRPNAVLTAGTTTNTYDAMGSVTQRGGLSLSYDHLGRLTQAQRDGASVLSVTYGTGFDRVKQVEGDSTTYFPTEFVDVRDGIANVYVNVGDTSVARAQSAGAAAATLSDVAPVSGAGAAKTVVGDNAIDIADAWIAQAASTNVVQLTGTTPSPVKSLLASAARRLLVDDVMWLHSDHLGSLVAATDTAGKLRAEQSFYPFGESRQATGFVDTYGFTGRERVAATGLIHYQYRQLDPRTGRWTQVDPAFREIGSGSLESPSESTTGYAYVANNFANNVDPLGLAGTPPAKRLRGAPTKGLIAAKIAQLVVALVGAAIAVVGATKAQVAVDHSQTAAETGNADLSRQAAVESASANRWAIGASAIGALSTTIGAGADIKGLHDQNKEAKKSAAEATALKTETTEEIKTATSDVQKEVKKTAKEVKALDKKVNEQGDKLKTLTRARAKTAKPPLPTGPKPTVVTPPQVVSGPPTSGTK